jgi:hypothetical protein
MVSENIELRVSLVDRRNAARELARVDDALERTGRSASRAGHLASAGSAGFDRMAGGVRKLAGFAGKGLVAGLAAGGAAVAGLTAFVGKGAQDMLNMQRIGAQTNAVIRSTGNASKVSSRGVGALADSIESHTGIEAESILAGQNMLLTFTNIRNEAGRGNKIFDQTTRTLADMTTALGSDAQSQAVQLGKALNDPIKGVAALSKVGVAFTEQQKKQIKGLVDGGKTMEAQKIILAELNKEFGGSANAFGQTDLGKIERFKAAVGNVQETMAGAFAPTIGRVSDALVKRGVPALERYASRFERDMVPKIRSGIGVLKDLYRTFKRDGLTAATERIEQITGTQGKLTPIVEKTRDVLKDLGRIITGSVVPAFTDNQDAITGILSPIGHLDDGVKFLADHATLTKNVIVGLVTALTLAKVATVSYAVANGLVTAATVGYAFATSLLTGAIVVNTGTERSAAAVRASSIALHIRGAIVTAASTVATLAGAAASGVWTAAQWLLNAALSANPIALVVVGIALLVGALVLAYKKSDKFRAIVDKVFGFLKKQPQVLLALLGPFGLLAAGLVTLYRNSEKFRTVLSDVLGVAKRVGSFLGNSFVTYVRTLAVAWLSMAGFGVKAFRMLVTAAFKAFDGILAGADKGLGWIPGLGGKIKDARRSFKEFGDATITKLKGVESQLTKARDRANELGKPRKTKIDVSVVYHHMGGRLALEDATIAGRASGGPVRKGVPYVVGERRPELFVPDENGTILPRLTPYRPPALDGGAAAHRELETAMNGGDRPAPISETISFVAHFDVDGQRLATSIHKVERSMEARA